MCNAINISRGYRSHPSHQAREAAEDVIDEFKDAKKLEIVQKTGKDTEDAIRLNSSAGGVFGVNDFTHALLAQRHADVFVTNDLKFIKTASLMVKTFTLEQFLAGL
ncbi:hypothetical protein HZC09_05535 [Candidatus Micrarchaeota archaeon]|nr:hypothetical protein [Candidatus Micrarchaeota archaeon]